MTWRGWMWRSAGSAIAAWAVLVPDEAAAANADCDSPIGMCSVSNDFDDSVSCECADGSGGFGGGGNEWAGLTEAELGPICLEQLDLFCGEGPPPTGVPCETVDGSCTVDNEPDSVSCDCSDGSGAFGGGGNDWDGLDDDALFDVCLEQVVELCGPPGPIEWDCETDFGGCDLELEPEPSYSCGCAGGIGGGGGPGGADWPELSEDELLQVCYEQIVEVCGGEVPTTDTGASAGTSETGPGEETSAGTEAGPVAETGDGTEEGPVAETGDGTTGGADDGDSTTVTLEESTSDTDSVTADGGGANDDGGGCGCDTGGRDRSGLVGLALVGLVASWRRRRR